MHTYIHASSGIRTNDPSFQASEDSLCLRLRGHFDRRGVCVCVCVYVISLAKFVLEPTAQKAYVTVEVVKVHTRTTSGVMSLLRGNLTLFI
jgi:hypothetical protein